MKNNQSNPPAVPQLLGLCWYLSKHLLLFGFILARAMGVTTAKDKSDFNSHGFGISKLSADPSAWQAGNFVITKCVMLLKSPCVYNDGRKGKDILCQCHRGGCGAQWMGTALLLVCPLSPLSASTWWKQQRGQGDGSSRGDRTADWGWQPCCKGLQELHPPLLQHHLDHTSSPLAQRERDGYIFLNYPVLTSEFTVRPKLNQQICWGPTTPNLAIYCNKL